MFGEGSISQRMLVLAKMIDRETSRRLQADFGLSVAQWRVLAFVCISGPATASFIGDAAEVDQAEISRAVKALIQAGLTSRDYQPGSRKTMLIAPTDAGMALFQRVRTIRQAYFATITQPLSAMERGQIDRALRVVAEQVVAHRTTPEAGTKRSSRLRR